MFSYYVGDHMQKFGRFWTKKIIFHPKKSLTSVLHQAIHLELEN